MNRKEIDWNPRNDANCEVPQPEPAQPIPSCKTCARGTSGTCIPCTDDYENYRSVIEQPAQPIDNIEANYTDPDIDRLKRFLKKKPIDITECAQPRMTDTLPEGFKVYICTNCQTINVKRDNQQITVGICDNCEHPLWNDPPSSVPNTPAISKMETPDDMLMNIAVHVEQEIIRQGKRVKCDDLQIDTIG